MDEQTKQSLLAEIEQYSPRTQFLQSGDLTVQDITHHYDCCETKAKEMMRTIEKNSNGEFVLLTVKKPGGMNIKVLRKKGA